MKLDNRRDAYIVIGFTERHAQTDQWPCKYRAGPGHQGTVHRELLSVPWQNPTGDEAIVLARERFLPLG